MAATAIEAWDERWITPEGRADWLVPHPAVAALVPVLKVHEALQAIARSYRKLLAVIVSTQLALGRLAKA